MKTLILNVGDRVVLTNTPAGFTSTKTGIVDMIDVERGGVLVRHDDGPVFGWTWEEVRPMLELSFRERSKMWILIVMHTIVRKISAWLG